MSDAEFSRAASLFSRDEALVMLRSDSGHERYLAARALVKAGLPADLNALMAQRKVENDAYARRWLGLAIAACARRGATEGEIGDDQIGEAVSVDARERIRTEAVEWVASALLHEIGSKIGLIVAAASREFPTYAGSDTERHVTNLLRVFEAITELRKAAALPKSREFDLAELVDDIVLVETAGTDISISLVGRKPLTVIADPDLLRLALSNGVRNAIEAVRSVKANSEHQVVVTWELTDKEYWISVIDHGPGVIGPIDAAFEIGRTNKKGHAGFGLAIARQAMEMLGGQVTLSPSAGGGATYELRGELRK